MKTIGRHFVALAAMVVLSSTFQSHGIVGLAIERQCTNIVISWPGQGHKYYLIQHRATLHPETPWTNLTNNYPANSTNRTTFTILGVAASCYGGEGGGGGGNPPSPLQSGRAPTGPVVMPKDGSKIPVPLDIYPPGIDLSGWIILWPDDSTDEWNAELVEKWRASLWEEGGSQLENFNGESEVECGFYRVFHIPDWAFNITNYTYGGPIFLPVDFMDYRELVAHIEVFLNGEPFPHADFTTYVSGGQTNWGMGVYFDRLTNGTYAIQLVTKLWLNDEIGDDGVYLILTNLARSIAVFNQVTFPDWNDFIQGDTYTFNAQLANSEADWWIDIYDALEFYVNTGHGHTTNGQISWTWNLLDWMGNNRDDFDNDPFFYAQITVQSAGNGLAYSFPMPPPVKGYPDRGWWLIAYQDRWYSDTPGRPADLQDKYEEAVDLIWGGPPLIGDDAIPHPLKFGTNVYTQAQREQTWTNLLGWLDDLYIRNFYYHGHGSKTIIGGDRHTLSANGIVIGGAFMHRGSKSTLQNWQIASISKYKRFRFVFLDGCSTAAGDLPNAFNISKQTNSISFYENHPKHPRPAAFVGWNQIVGGDETWGSAYKRHEFQAAWMGNWANSFPPISIFEALDTANRDVVWVDRAKLWDALRVYGYQDLTIRSYNRKADWRWP